MTRAFVKEEEGKFPYGFRKDWHGYWKVEYLNPRSLIKDERVVTSFEVLGKKNGQYPLAINASV